MDAAPTGPTRRDGSAPLTAIILGNDAVVAARPATPAQLVRACVAAGFGLVAPPGLGDELIAGAYLEALASRGEPVIVACTCVRVTALVDSVATPAGPLARVRVAPPPVAAARYLRLTRGEPLHITYVGDCPSGNDASIDAWLTPAALFTRFERAGIGLGSQPTDVDAPAMPGWSRYTSMPGGLPALRFLAREPVSRVLRVVDPAALAGTSMSVSRFNVLADLSDAARCACAQRRDCVEEGEPPRASTPIVARPPGLDLGPTIEPIAQPAREPLVAMDVAAPAPTGAPPPAEGRARRAVTLAVLPLVVLASVAALGIAAYSVGRGGELRRAARTNAAPAAAAGAGTRAPRSGRMAGGEAPGALGGTTPVGDPAGASMPTSSGAAEHDALPPDSAAATLATTDSAGAAADSTGPKRPRRARRAGGYRVVPGWLPQGRGAWPPADTARPRKTDRMPPPVPSRPDTGAREPNE